MTAGSKTRTRLALLSSLSWLLKISFCVSPFRDALFSYAPLGFPARRTHTIVGSKTRIRSEPSWNLSSFVPEWILPNVDNLVSNILSGDVNTYKYSSRSPRLALCPQPWVLCREVDNGLVCSLLVDLSNFTWSQHKGQGDCDNNYFYR